MASPVVMSIPCAKLVSRYHFPVRGARAPWRNETLGVGQETYKMGLEHHFMPQSQESASDGWVPLKGLEANLKGSELMARPWNTGRDSDYGASKHTMFKSTRLKP